MAATLILLTGFTSWAKPTRRNKPPPVVEQQETEIDEMAVNDQRWVSTTGNLGAAASWYPSEVPEALDRLFFDGASQVSANVNMSAFSAFELAKIWISSPYYGDIGANGNPLACKVRWLIHEGQGALYHAYADCATESTSCVINSPNKHNAYTLTSTNTGSSLSLYLLNGQTTIAPAVTNIYRMMVGSTNVGSYPIVDIRPTTSVIQTYYQSSGYVRAVGGAGATTIIDGGVFIYDATGAANWGTTVFINGGVFKYNGTGIVPMIYVTSGGTLDMTGDTRAKALSYLTLMPGSTFLTHENVTVAHPTDLRGPSPILP